MKGEISPARLPPRPPFPLPRVLMRTLNPHALLQNLGKFRDRRLFPCHAAITVARAAAAGRCPGCGESRVLVYAGEDGLPVVTPCYRHSAVSNNDTLVPVLHSPPTPWRYRWSC